MIIEYSYRYLGDNGSCFENKLEEFTDEACAIICLGSTSFHQAINGIEVDRVIGGDEGALERIRAGMKANIAEREKKKRITLVKDQIRQLERFFETIDNDILVKTQHLEDARIELRELESE